MQVQICDHCGTRMETMSIPWTLDFIPPGGVPANPQGTNQKPGYRFWLCDECAEFYRRDFVEVQINVLERIGKTIEARPPYQQAALFDLWPTGLKTSW